MTRREEIKEIVAACVQRFDHGSSEDWKHSDFLRLSRAIFTETKVNISYSTLKRIFGKTTVDEDYIPQEATLEALIKYGGYTRTRNVEPDPVSLPNASSAKQPSSKYYRVILIFAVVILAGSTAYWLFHNKNPNLGKITLSSLEGNVPSTAYFNLKIPITDDSVFVDFGDRTPFALVKRNQQSVSHNYLIPGVFKVQVYINKHVIANTTVAVTSNKWIALGFRRQRELPEHYYAFPATRNYGEEIFHISNKQLSSVGIDTSASRFTRLCNFKDTEVSGDRFIFETSCKIESKQDGIYCSATQVKISGSEGSISFRLVSPGCSSSASWVTGEVFKNGYASNLSALAIDLAKWNTIKVLNQNKEVSLFINDKMVMKNYYRKSIGNIMGVFVEFEGTGFIKQCQLFDQERKELFKF